MSWGTIVVPVGTAPPRQVLNTIVAADWFIAAAAIFAVGVAAAILWPAAAAALVFRAGYAAGVAWARLRSFGMWLLDGVKRIGIRARSDVAERGRLRRINRHDVDRDS